MSDHHHVEQPWFERYWQIGVIAFAIAFVVFLFAYGPGTAPGEDGHVSAGTASHKQVGEELGHEPAGGPKR